MKRVYLSDDQIERIVQFRENGLPWVRIEKETGVPRRIAKREYEAWSRNQSERQLQEVRKNVVAQEYRVHLELLSRLANLLITSLTIPHPQNDMRKAGEIMSQFLAKDIYPEELSFGLPTEESSRNSAVKRMNELLLKSLRDHTQRKVPWEALEEWEASRDRCLLDIPRLKDKIVAISENLLDQKQNQQLKEQIAKARMVRDHQKPLSTGILLHLWTNDFLGTKGEITAYQGTSLFTEGTAWVRFHNEAHEETSLVFATANQVDNVNLAKDVVRLANWAIENLRLGETALFNEMKNEVHKMRKATSTLEAGLNPLILRPMILSTKCDICPV